MEIFGTGLEEFGVGMGTSLLFGGVGRTVGRRMAGRRGLVPRTAEYENLENAATTVGDLSAGIAQTFAPRLVQSSTLARLYPDQPQERQEQQEDFEARKAEESLANAVLASGSLLLPRAASLDDVISPLALL